ncbi:MAG: hypothetical protein HY769_02815 [Candidatus Stahlbacteria bacterium]|nr:hypothetical protein [Candidatus Stahlbacteria bacterium]
MRGIFIMLALGSVSYGEGVKIQLPPNIVLEPKSHKKAIALSLLLPGLGEQYMGSKSDALRAYTIETGIWSTFFGLRWYAGVLAKDCLLYACANADAKSKQNNEYYETVEWYKNLEAYNIAVKEDARSRYPDSLEEQLKYIEENSLPDSLWWEWQDEKKWDEYRSLRSNSRSMFRNTSYCIGLAIVNRIVSAIIATHLPTSGLGLEVEPNGVKIRVAFK